MNKFWNILLSPLRKWLSIFDRYIIGKFLATTFFTFAIILSISIVIDYSEKSDNFIKYHPSTQQIIFDYYLNFIPYISALLAPLLIFLAVIFFTSRMAYNSEIIAVLNGGMSFRRFMRPYIICGVFSGLLLLYANHWLVPQSNKVRIDFENKYTKPPKTFDNNIHLRIDNNTLITLERFKYTNGEGNNFALERFEGSGVNKKMVYKINADKIVHLPGITNWRLVNYKRWTIYDSTESFKTGKQLDTILNMQPEDFNVSEVTKDALNYEEMEKFMQEEKQKGASGLEFYKVETNRRTSSAISVIILVLIGASLGSRKIRGGIGLNLVFAIALSSLYVVFLQFSSTFSTNGNLPPVIGTNIPNFIFLIITIYLIRLAGK